ncbi:MAG: methyltransferase domain-containing protein [Bryobacterales bacterium]|nr:methyltransferase domain-containing protein [Bryobacterales bacterium]
MPRSVVRPYKLLAEHYDELFGFARSWGEFARTNLLANVLPKIDSACDLACGTGTAALELARRGLKVYAVDLSPTMCVSVL